MNNFSELLLFPSLASLIRPQTIHCRDRDVMSESSRQRWERGKHYWIRFLRRHNEFNSSSSSKTKPTKNQGTVHRKDNAKSKCWRKKATSTAFAQLSLNSWIWTSVSFSWTAERQTAGMMSSRDKWQLLHRHWTACKQARKVDLHSADHSHCDTMCFNAIRLRSLIQWQ